LKHPFPFNKFSDVKVSIVLIILNLGEICKKYTQYLGKSYSKEVYVTKNVRKFFIITIITFLKRKSNVIDI